MGSNAIVEFAQSGNLDGYGDGIFKPEGLMTRTEFVKTVDKVFAFSELASSEKFSDVEKGDWYYEEILKAVKQGYINGYDDNIFRPNGKITKREAASIIANLLDLERDGKLEFKDNTKITDWAKDSLDELNDNGIMGGYSDNTFRPKNNITRAETVSMLSRINIK